MVTGMVGRLRVNCAAENVTLETVMLVVPLLVAVRLKVLLLATGTLPKSRLRGVTPRLPEVTLFCGGGVEDFPALNP